MKTVKKSLLYIIGGLSAIVPITVISAVALNSQWKISLPTFGKKSVLDLSFLKDTLSTTSLPVTETIPTLSTKTPEVKVAPKLEEGKWWFTPSSWIRSLNSNDGKTRFSIHWDQSSKDHKDIERFRREWKNKPGFLSYIMNRRDEVSKKILCGIANHVFLPKNKLPSNLMHCLKQK